MKRFILLFLNLFVIASLQILFAQKLPFQGRLFENDMPVTGQVNLEFSITGFTWTETHPNVSVSEGLYSIDLGSITPLPSTLFFGVESRTLQVKVNGTMLEPITLYPSLTGNNFVMEVDEAPDGKDAVSYTISGVGTTGKIYRPFVGTSSVANGLNGGVTGIGISPVGNTNNTYGIFGRATGEGSGQNRGVYGEAISHLTSTSAQYGLVGRAYGEGTGIHYGVFGEITSPAISSASQYGGFFRAQGGGTGAHFGIFATSTGAHDNFGALTTATGNGKNNIGIRGLASGSGNGEPGYGVGSYNSGVQGYARSNSWGNLGVYGYVYNDPVLGGIGVDNIGVIGRSEVNNGTAEMSNVGVRGQANGSGINKGIVGVAFDGAENWAGWFEGDVKVTGNLSVDGQGGSISATSIRQDYGNFGKKDWEGIVGMQGYLDLRGDAPEGKDNIRVGLDVQRNNDGETFGNLNLFGPVYTDPSCPTCPRGFVGARVEKRENGQVSGRLDINGPTSPNFRFEGKGWQNSNLPSFSLLGSQQHADGWFHQHVSIEVNEENGSQAGFINLYGNSGNPTLTLGSKLFEGTTGANRPFLSMRGQDNNQNLVWLDVRDDGDGGEMGFINFLRTSGEFTDIDSRTINLNNKVVLNTDSKGDGKIQVNSQSGTALRMYANLDNENTSHIALDGTGGNYIYLWGQGSIQASGTITATSVFETSDKRLKTNITPLSNSLSNITKLRGVSFNWADASKSQEMHIGLIAQELEAVYPEFVKTDDKGVKAINYSQMVSVLIESIKELNAKVEFLEEQNKSLAISLSENAKLKQELDLLKELVLKSVQGQVELVQLVK